MVRTQGMSLAMGALVGLMFGFVVVASVFLLDRLATERERNKRARAIRVGWMPLKPSVDEIKLRIKCENKIDRSSAS